ncbi:uncharacterized protein NPIL_520551 [Nephila pilipes]|uniref:Tc1-like transposase DDE domain-containing protein n=1 Tax=Nephila pilipes TaxID=299642 RepID=A0A8X6QH58_NEPPI|nr:uncharacterized protein NPIL_520551 [Nephila pilipes]
MLSRRYAAAMNALWRRHASVLNPQVHRQNARIWRAENPHPYFVYGRNTPKENVWCVLMNDEVIRPIFFEKQNITSSNYLDILELSAMPQFPKSFIIQHDGASLHHANIVREILDKIFRQPLVVESSVKPWPPWYPNLAQLEFYLRDHVKQHVYSERINDINYLRQRVPDVIL